GVLGAPRTAFFPGPVASLSCNARAEACVNAATASSRTDHLPPPGATPRYDAGCHGSSGPSIPCTLLLQQLLVQPARPFSGSHLCLCRMVEDVRLVIQTDEPLLRWRGRRRAYVL